MKRCNFILVLLFILLSGTFNAQTPDSTAAGQNTVGAGDPGTATLTPDANIPVPVSTPVTETTAPASTSAETTVASPAIPDSSAVVPPPASEPVSAPATTETTVPVPSPETPNLSPSTETTVPATSSETTTTEPATEPPALSPPAPIEAPVTASAGAPVYPLVVTTNKNIIKALHKANDLYNSKAYIEAIPFYEKVLATDRTNKAILSNLGDCYRLTNNTLKQVECYGALVNSGGADPIHELYYAQALLENGEVEKAKPYFEKFTLDNRGKEMTTAFSRLNNYKKNADAYSVEPAVLYNSPESDFCAVKFRDAVVFASTRNKTVWIRKQQAWTDGNYLGLYTLQTALGGQLKPKLFMQDLESKFNDGPICFSKDFNTVFITRNNAKDSEKASDGTYKLKLLVANLDQNGFSMIKPMPFNNNNYNYAHPSISPDGYTLYFASDMPGGKGGMDIYRTRKDSSGVWGSPENLGEQVNTAGNEMFPFIAGNGILYFSSNGHDGLGGLDIYEAKLMNGTVSKIYNMGEPVNSKDDDFGIYLGEDNKNGFISSNRANGGLNDDIFTLQILRDVKRGKEALIVVKDKENGTALDSTKLVINNDTIMTNEKGEYALQLEEQTTYIIKTVKNDYFTKTDTVSASTSTEDSFTKEVIIEKDPKLFLRALITDAKTGELLDGVSIKLTDIAASEEVDNYTTTSSGDYFKQLYGKRLGDKLTYLIRLEKPGYLQRTMVFSHTVDKPGEINMNQTLNLALGKVEVGMDLAKMIDIKPIYFDLGKSDIRKDAAEELDKIVQIMNEYPNMYIELGSHTDCRSSSESNMKLSTARAKASAAYIVKRGINKMRITGRGYGESRLLNNCACEGKVKSTCPEEEHNKNRRTEFLITRLK